MSFRVLICDDSTLARKLTKKSLPEGFAAEVEQATNGQEALALINEKEFDLLLLDLTMPVLDGVGVLEQLKATGQKLMTIVISGDVQPDMQAKVRQLGIMDFLAKPVDSERLEHTLRLYGLW